MDKTRDEVIEWCIDNMIDFTDPIFPPPDGWVWADNDGYAAKSLTPIFTNTKDDGVDPVDIVFKLYSSDRL